MNEQLSPVNKLTLLTDMVEEPDMVEPEPQNPSAGRAVAANPDKVAFKSLVKFKSVMLVRSKLEMLYVRVVLAPGEVAAGKLMYMNGNSTFIEALADGICWGMKLPDS